MVGQAWVIQTEAGTSTVQVNKRHLDGDNNDDTGLDKYPPSLNDRAIYTGYIFLDLYLQRGGGPQRPLKPPWHEAYFLDNDVPLFQT